MDSIMDYSFGISQQSVGIDFEKGIIFIQKAELLDPFGKALGYQNGDVIKKINGEDFPKLGPELQGFIGGVMEAMKEGEVFNVTVERKNDDSTEEVLLSTEIIKVKKAAPFNLTIMEEATPKQTKLRNAWLGIE